MAEYQKKIDIVGARNTIVPTFFINTKITQRRW